MTNSNGSPATRRLLIAACAGMLAACTSTSTPTPDQMARTTLQTAPADLQLLCADAVANSARVDRARVLPMSSRQVDAANYNVEVDAGGGRKFNCVVDNTGKVSSVQPA